MDKRLRSSGEPLGGPKVCLVMMVKNESGVIARCLESIKPFIHCWAVIDTGSTDGTQAIVSEVLGDLPGSIEEAAWEDFSTHRNQGIDLARIYNPDYFLTIDADEWLTGSPCLTGDEVVGIAMIDGGDGHPLPRCVLLKADLPWRYVGKIHECPMLPDRQMVGVPVPGLTYSTRFDGARHCVDGWDRSDLLLMVKEVQGDPTDQRKVHLLARMLDAKGFRDAASDLYAQSQDYVREIRELGAA